MRTKTKSTVLLSLIMAIVLITFQSCNKYEEGPAFSMRTRTARVANLWEIETYTVNGVYSPVDMTNYTESFTSKGQYRYVWEKRQGTGIWEFQSNDEQIKLFGNDTHSNRTLFILKLEEEAFWYYFMEGNDRHEFHLVHKKHPAATDPVCQCN